jgi:hypothetical protein
MAKLHQDLAKDHLFLNLEDFRSLFLTFHELLVTHNSSKLASTETYLGKL